MSQSSYVLMKIGDGKAIIFLQMVKLHYLGNVCVLGRRVRVYNAQDAYCQHYYP
jgi:hypothetical protein